MTWGLVAATAIGVGGGLLTSSMNAGATRDASNIAAGSANRAADIQQGIYNQTRADLSPFTTAGTGALSQLSQILGIGGGAPDNTMLFRALEQSPGYQFSLQQGLNAVNASGAARGLLNSGATIKAATSFGQGLAQSTLGDYLNRLGGIANLGQNSAAMTGNIGNTAAANAGQSLIAGGNAAGSGILGSQLQMSGGINQALNNSLLALKLGGGFGGGGGSGGINGMFSTGGTFGPSYTGNGIGEW